MINASTKLSSLSKYKIRKIAKIVVKFCMETFGVSRNKFYPNTTISFKNDTGLFGVYDGVENLITIYVNECKTVSVFTSTIIHEWTHSKQNIVGKYNKLLKKFGYENHPMEIEARETEKKWNRKDLNYMKKNM
jgi:hypothetical protein